MYGLSYPKATLVEKAGKSGYYACVTIPVALRPFFKNRRQQYKALGKDIRTTREAYETGRLREKETLIWREFDEADLANHPLAVAYLALEDKLAKQSDASPFWSINDLFDQNKRFDLEDDIRQRTAEEMGVARSAFDDFEVGGWASAKYSELENFLRIFLEEFRKLSEERFSPKKRGKLFSDVAKEYFKSPIFLKNKKTNQPKRQKTLAKENNLIYIRTFEKGVERETLSCGTGAVASSVVCSKIFEDNFPLIKARGGDLRVNYKKKRDLFYDITLSSNPLMEYNSYLKIISS